MGWGLNCIHVGEKVPEHCLVATALEAVVCVFLNSLVHSNLGLCLALLPVYATGCYVVMLKV